AEDTRVTRRLLNHLGIKVAMTSYNPHNQRAKSPAILEALEDGDVALVTDAGMPGLSDPGAELVTLAASAGFAVEVVPAVSAVTTALAGSGFPGDAFMFLGFLPRRSRDRRALLQTVGSSPLTLIIFEAPHRVGFALNDLLSVLGDRDIAVCREMTKLHQEVFRGTVSGALDHFTEPRGEFVLVVAGAGTGKTRTLVYRVAYLVETGTAPEGIVLLTFTRRAAREMLTRASALLDGRCQQVRGGTFHAYCLGLLRRHAPRIGFENNFTILDSSDAADVLDVLRTARGFHKAKKRFPRKKTRYTMFSASMNREQTLEAVLEARYPQFFDDLVDLKALRQDYQLYKQRHGLMDYDDLLAHTLRLFDSHDEVRTQVAAGCRHVLVDEYQDTNRLQAQIIRLLAATHDNVMVVGDDAQSIYSFRGANFRNIMDFPKDFPGTRLIFLEENYRSTQPILNLTNEIIHRAKERYEKNLFTRKGHGDSPLLVQAENEQMQSRFVRQKVLELREEGVPLWEIAVLFRSSFHSFDLEIELGRCDIPFVKRGGFKFMESAHVKDLLAHLRISSNPQDTVSWGRALSLLDGVGPQLSQKVIRWVHEGSVPWERLRSYKAKGKVALGLRTLAQVLEASSERARPAEQAQYFMQYYLPLLKRKYSDDYPKRIRDLEHLLEITERYRSLERLLSDMALEPPTDSVDGVLAVDPDEGPLVLSTIHSAKGLEWHSVFIIWALEGRFPSFYNIHTEEDLEEERRLLYVAATRAKENLFITYPINFFDRSSGAVLSRPSQFIDGLPEKLLEPVYLAEEEEYEDWEM
ncbi:MAG: 16S rRNA (cytidine(1402)-2'-O)-methyltransferase, partial [Deltaproteobacteria bacterium]|nr:16S rRNA (cytidine(1402)-2'-O)-methyltransferase [Deltaproteobacteria bacterium]